MFGVQSNLKVQLFKHLQEIRELMKQEDISYIVGKKLKDGTMKPVRIDIKNKKEKGP